MANVVVEVEVPEAVVEFYGGVEPLRRALQKIAVLGLVRRGDIDPSRGAELLGVPLGDFIDLMDAHGMPFFHYTKEEWDAELVAVEAIGRTLDGAGK